MLHAGQGVFQFLHHAHAVKITAAVAHAIHRKQHLGFNLFKPIQHGVGAHVRRTNAPNAPNAGGGQKGHHRLGNIGQIGCHPVPRLYALRQQMQGHGRHLAL